MAKQTTKKRAAEIQNIQELLQKTRIIPVDVKSEMSKSFIAYAMAVNVSRAIPDVRDGLKPVHRRILYAMYDMNNTCDKPTKKCARIVGEVMGKYHPHGDASVYDALVRLAQDFSINIPLIEGQGNFGTVDGDPPAAARYTEARLAKIANEILRDIDKETVDFYPNFDDTLMQPVVLPSRFPNLLVNGSEGIAVGMATSIPPHNLSEVIAATIALIDNPEITIDELMDIVPAPDYPTGGIIYGRAAVRTAFRTGHGGVVIRARATIEEDKIKSRIIVTELPYQVNKAELIKAIAELVKDKKIEGISDIKDESDRFGMRVVIDVKRDANASVVLNSLYKQSNLQVSTGINFLTLVRGTPVVLNLKAMLEEYVSHQISVVERRTKFSLEKAREREHIVHGLVIAQANIDEVISIIKKSPDRNACMTNLCERFLLSDKQANAILEMKLARITQLEVSKLKEELSALEKEIADLEDILAKPERVREIIKTELTEINEAYGEKRKTEISTSEADINIADLVPREDVIISMTDTGYIKRIAVSEYKHQGRAGVGVMAHKTKDEDFIKHMFICHSHDDLLFFSNKGKAYKLKAFIIPEASKIAKGRAIVNLLTLEEGEKITAFLPIRKRDEKKYIIMGTREGLIRKSEISDFDVVNKNGKIAISLLGKDELITADITSGEDEIIVATHNGYCIRFSEKDIRKTARGSQGVRAVRLTDKDFVVDMAVVKYHCSVITVSEKGFGKRTPIDQFRAQARAGRGIFAGKFTAKTGKLVNMKLVAHNEDVILISDNGTMIRVMSKAISAIGRYSRGVTIMKVRGAKVVSMALAPHDDEAEFTEIAVDEAELKAAQLDAIQEEPVEAEGGEGEVIKKDE